MSTPLILQKFGGIQDLARVKSFLRGRAPWLGLPDYWNAGKSTVGTYQTLFDSPRAHHTFWCDQGGKFHAYLWVHPTPSATIEGNANSWRVFMHPEVRSTALAHTMIDTAEVRLTQLGCVTPIETVAYGADLWLIDLLESRGYQRREALDVYLHRDLREPIDAADPVAGYDIRPLDVESDLLQRAGAQSDAFTGEPEPGEWSIANTRRFFTWYEGRQDLDLVASDPNGEIASFAVFLVDGVTGVGELDPVGTRTAHQRKGLSKAVLRTGLRYLQSMSMRKAVVRTGVANLPAIRTYQAAGFVVADQLFRFSRG